MDKDQEENNTYDLNINIIGDSISIKTLIEKFGINQKKDILYKFVNNWKWQYNDSLSYKEQIKEVFNIYEKNRDNTKIAEQKDCLIIIFPCQNSYILKNINNINNKDYMPFTIFLFKDQKFNLDYSECPNVDPRKIDVIENFSFKENEMSKITERLLRFCSYYNELGEEIQDSYILSIDFPLNIYCLGRPRQGKSTTVNTILGEIKAKETAFGTSQTQKYTKYYVKNHVPIQIFDFPGFESDKLKEFKQIMKKANENLINSNEKVHIILYIINCGDPLKFNDFEFEIFKKIIKHEDSKLIFIFTHSLFDENQQEERKTFIININKDLNTIIEKGSKSYHPKKKNKNNVIEEIKKKIKIEEKNIVFLNYYKKGFIPVFGVNNLFRKIIELFKETKTYNTNKKTDLINKAKNFKEKAQKQLDAKFMVTGTIVGIIPFFDSLIRNKYIISNKKDQILQTFEYKETENNKGNSQIIEQSANLLGTAGYTGGTISIINRVNITTEQIMHSERYYFFFTRDVPELVSKEVVSKAKYFGGIGTLAISALIGFASGAYSMINEKKDLEKMIDKLYNWYLNNSGKIGDSYENAILYLTEMENKNKKNGL